jgi:hypothetical protein
MNRIDYINTVEGQVSLRNRRKRNIIYFSLEGQEPKSKNAISDAEKFSFQKSILTVMAARRRRHFKAPVAVEFDFFPTKNDPPAIHTMPKNYLDLLEKPKGIKTKRKRLVLTNDRRVDYLAVKYHILPDRSQSAIQLKVGPHRDFIADISLLDKIKNQKLGIAPDGIGSSVSWDRLIYDDEAINQDNHAIDCLQEHERQRKFWISNFGEDAFEALHEMYLIDAQNHLLRTLALTPNKLIYLLSPQFTSLSSVSASIYGTSRDNLLGPPLAIDLRHSDLKNGESSIFKNFVKKTMRTFRRKFHRLFPLRAQVGITILYQPPARPGKTIDLDNLARRIVPFVNEELEPPSNHILTVNAERYIDYKLRQWYQEKQNSLKRMPKHSITHYQVVQLPRLISDAEHGFVRLLLEPGEYFESLWTKVENLLNRWQEKI